MVAAIILAFLAALGVVVWASIVALFRRAALWLRFSYGACVVGAAVAAYFTTFRFSYYANQNTEFHGWPVPVVIFQRKSPTSPWLDFVHYGDTSILGLAIIHLSQGLPSLRRAMIH